MERLLFDDILDSGPAREEHDLFWSLLEKAGAQVLDPEDLMAEVFTENPVVRRAACDTLETHYGLAPARRAYLEGLEPTELAEVFIRGLRVEGPLARGKARRFFDLDPLPNYFFQRDPQVVLGDRVVIPAMATSAREREPFLARLAFEHHPALAGYKELFQMDLPTHWEPEFELEYPYPELEGGDILVASDEVVLVGVSARTNMQGAELLAEYLRAQEEISFRHLLIVQLPMKRSYMHLDTVFTFIDRGLCLAYLPVVQPGRVESARVYHVDLDAKFLALSPRWSLQDALAEVGMEVELVPCGGAEDMIVQQREQWTDGANAFALAPGLIALYQRNRRTIDELRRRGWRALRCEDALSDGVELVGQGPTVVTLTDHELSRARGGPRCMTMPLERDPLGDS